MFPPMQEIKKAIFFCAALIVIPSCRADCQYALVERRLKSTYAANFTAQLGLLSLTRRI